MSSFEIGISKTFEVINTFTKTLDALLSFEIDISKTSDLIIKLEKKLLVHVLYCFFLKFHSFENFEEIKMLETILVLVLERTKQFFCKVKYILKTVWKFLILRISFSSQFQKVRLVKKV